MNHSQDIFEMSSEGRMMAQEQRRLQLKTGHLAFFLQDCHTAKERRSVISINFQITPV
jgi:hypothetical protein